MGRQTSTLWAIPGGDLNEVLGLWLKNAPGLATPNIDCGACTLPQKCCGFQPFIANFLLGAHLAAGGELPSGDQFMALPIGLVASRNFRRAHAAGEVGLRCAFLTAGRCAIRRYRPGECSTYYCGSMPAEREALSGEAFVIETAIAQMALARAGFGPREISRQVDFINDPEAPTPTRWGGEHASDPPEIYRSAWTWAQTLSGKDVQALWEES